MKNKRLFVAALMLLPLIGAACAKKPVVVNEGYSTDEPTNVTPTPTPEPTNNTSMNVSKKGPIADIKTTKGTVRIQLFEESAPVTVENFVKLANQDFYDGIVFHRVIKDFMIQGGDPLTRTQPENKQIHGTGGPGYTFEDEINGHKLVRGVLAMANAGPGTNGSQFFIITADSTPWLDGRHTAFGEVIEGMDIVDAISNVKTLQDRPVEDIKIIDVLIEANK